MANDPTIKCPRCGSDFAPRVRTQMYCSYRCKKAAKLARDKAEWKAEGELEREIAAQQRGKDGLRADV
jgi:endogenous inhibitor of DNA gyrase (YacG/DUF329 family)